jgi:hypothetical protein
VLVAGGFSFHTAKLSTPGGLSLLTSYFLLNAASTPAQT